MADKKEPQSAQPKIDPAIEKRVDSMMNPRSDAAKAANTQPATPPTPASSTAPIDIFTDPKTAPEVPKEVLQEVGIAAKSEPEPPTPPQPVATPAEAPKAPADSSLPEADLSSAEFDDPDTDKAVDDIVSKESDTVLAAEDALNKQPHTPEKSSWKDKVKQLFKRRRTWVAIGLVIVVVLGVPVTRYKLFGLVLKRDVSIIITDSKTETPVSSADITLAGKSAKTDANGKVKISAALGSQQIEVSKKYYTTQRAKVFVGFKAPAEQHVELVATGRQVPITVINTITGKPLANAEIKVSGTTAKTNSKGKATLVLPTRSNEQEAHVGLSGYNQSQVTVKVTDKVDSANTFKLTPTGHVYFLSNLKGTLDVVKTNLDGTGRQTVVTGTGNEDPSSTSLLATRDWRYVVLAAKRDVRQSLYLIDTSNDKMTQFDSSNANFTLVGWSGHNFVYDLVSNTVPESQAGHELLKSYDAEDAQLNQLDQNQADGKPDAYGYQGFGNFYILENTVVYSTRWYTYEAGGNFDLGSKTNSIRAVQPGKQNKKDYQTFAAEGNAYIQSALYKPLAVHFAISNYKEGNVTYYNFESQSISSANLEQTDITKSYPTYLVSPNGNQTFWTELRDGKNALLVGDISGSKSKQIANLSDYKPYGWYSDNYVLVSKGGSQLYVMPSTEVKDGYQPVKISDYYKPSQSFEAYGYGYGGL